MFQAEKGIPCILLASSLFCSALHVAMSLLISQAEQDFPGIFLSNLAATFLFLTVLHFLVWYLVVALLVRNLALKAQPAALATSFSVLVLSLLFPLVEFSATNAGHLFAPLALIAVTAILSSAVLGYFGALHCAGLPSFADLLSKSIRTLPTLAALTLALVWLLQTTVKIRNHSSGWPTPAASIALLFYFMAVAAILAFGRRPSRNAKPPARSLLGLALLTLASPALPPLSERIGAWRTGSPTSHSLPVRQILLITVDTLRADVLGAYQADSTLSPRIDELAAESIVFLNARSPAPHTKPAIASILTGLSPPLHGAISATASVTDGVRTAAQMLSEKGYVTGAIGRNSNLSHVFDFDRGFDTYRMHLGSAVRSNPSLGTKLLKWGEFGMAEPSTDRLAEGASRWLRLHRDDPFFLWVHFFDPHSPFSPPPRWLPKNAGTEDLPLAFDDTAKVREGVTVLSAAEKEWVRELYRAEVRYVDSAVGSLLDTARHLGLYDESLVVFASDHGEEFFEHGSIGHGHTLYDEVLRVPLMIKLPRSENGQRDESLVSTESITPTILRLARARFAPEDFSSPVLPGPWATARDDTDDNAIVSGAMLYYEDRIAVAFDHWKYSRSMESGAEELYSIDQDYWELTSVASSHEEVVDRARSLLASHLDEVERLRKRLNLSTSSSSESELRKDVLEDLKALGYL